MNPAQIAGFTELLAEVNLPQFVAGLIQGVFQAIGDRGGGELVHGLGEFFKQFAVSFHLLAIAFPDCLVRDSASGALRWETGAGCAEALPRFRSFPLLGPLRELRPADLEKKLVPAALRRLAAQRQQLAASMVLMGINQIVATNGRIEA